MTTATVSTVATARAHSVDTGAKFLAGLKATFEALGAGLAAHRDYEALRARGVPHVDAAARALGTIKRDA